MQIADVKAYWESSPLCASAIPYQPGTAEYFRFYDGLREANEPIGFSRELHEYDHFSGRCVLDVGSGNGYVLSRYAAAGAQVFGVDLTEQGVRLCQSRFRLTGLHGEFTVGNAEQLPFADAAFDCVCSMGVLHHTPDTRRAVEEVRRVLKPGGRLIVMFYHRSSVQYRLKFPLVKVLTGRSIQQQVNDVDGVGNPKGDVYSKKELAELLSGFERLELFAGLFPWHKLPAVRGVLPSRLRTWCDRRWGWFLYAKGWRR